jgi:GTPase SAR1 family protein
VFRSIVSAYYKGANGVVIVFDLASRDSFLSMQDYWYKEIQEHRDAQSVLMLLGNKSDLP